jgi:5-methylcytosine-specific restriction protein A
MPETRKEIRSDPVAAGEVIDSVFEQTPGAAKRSYLEFLAASIEYLSEHHADRWGVTLFDWGLRLNAGWVECLVLRPGDLRVLVYEQQVPAGTNLSAISYRYAPGCDMTTVPLADLPRSLPPLAESHHAALYIAAKIDPPRNIRKAHSSGVAAHLSRVLGRVIPNPSYAPSADSPALSHLDEDAVPEIYSEGGRTAVVVNRYERDPRAREICISHHGSRCCVCNMRFAERYGETMKDFIHVHHLIPLSDIGTEYRVDPIADLRPVCPNCHGVIHRHDPPLSIEQARELLSR